MSEAKPTPQHPRGQKSGGQGCSPQTAEPPAAGGQVLGPRSRSCRPAAGSEVTGARFPTPRVSAAPGKGDGVPPPGAGNSVFVFLLLLAPTQGPPARLSQKSPPVPPAG